MHLANAVSFSAIKVTADYFELAFDSDTATFRGNVFATQANYTFRTEALTLHLDQLKGDSQAGKQSNNTSSESDVKYELSANTVNYNLEDGLINGIGDSQLKRGQELIKADRISYSVERRVAFAEPKDGQQVTVQFVQNPELPVFPTYSPIAHNN